MTRNVKLLCLAGGRSSRFGGTPKAFTEVGPNGEYLIQLILNQALECEFSEIVIVISSSVQQEFEEKLGHEYHGVPIKYAIQTFDPETRDRPWGTTDAILAAREYLDCPFVVANSDDLVGVGSFQILFDHLLKSDNCLTVCFPLLSMLPRSGEVNRGTFMVQDGFVTGFVENVNISRSNYETRGLFPFTPTNANLFGLHPSMLDDLDTELKEFQKTPDRRAEAIIGVDLMKLIEKERIRMCVMTSNEIWRGVTNQQDAQDLHRELSI